MEILKPFRAKIDAIDDQIVDLLAERFSIIEEVGYLKAREGIKAVLQDRVDEVRERNADRAKEKGIDADFVREMYRDLIQRSCDMEDDIISENKDGRSEPDQRSA